MDDFGEVGAIRLTVPRTPGDLQDLSRFFVLLDGVYEDCVKLATLLRVPTETDSNHQQKLLGSLDDMSGVPRPRVKRLEGGSLLLELLRDSSWAQAGSALAALAAALKGVERVATTPSRIRHLQAKQERLRAEENAKQADAKAQHAEADARRARAEAEAASFRYYSEAAERMSQDTLTTLTVALSRLHELTGGEPEVEEIPEDGEGEEGGDE